MQSIGDKRQKYRKQIRKSQIQSFFHQERLKLIERNQTQSFGIIETQPTSHEKEQKNSFEGAMSVLNGIAIQVVEYYQSNKKISGFKLPIDVLKEIFKITMLQFSFKTKLSSEEQFFMCQNSLSNGRQLLKQYVFKGQTGNFTNNPMFLISTPQLLQIFLGAQFLYTKQQDLAVSIYFNLFYEKTENDRFPSVSIINKIVQLALIGSPAIKVDCVGMLRSFILTCQQATLVNIFFEANKTDRIDLIGCLINVIQSNSSLKVLKEVLKLYYVILHRIKDFEIASKLSQVQKINKYLNLIIKTNQQPQFALLILHITFQLTTIFKQEYEDTQLRNSDMLTDLITHGLSRTDQFYHKKLYYLLSIAARNKNIFRQQKDINNFLFPYFNFLLFGKKHQAKAIVKNVQLRVKIYQQIHDIMKYRECFGWIQTYGYELAAQSFYSSDFSKEVAIEQDSKQQNSQMGIPDQFNFNKNTMSQSQQYQLCFIFSMLIMNKKINDEQQKAKILQKLSLILQNARKILQADESINFVSKVNQNWCSEYSSRDSVFQKTHTTYKNFMEQTKATVRFLKLFFMSLIQ